MRFIYIILVLFIGVANGDFYSKTIVSGQGLINTSYEENVNFGVNDMNVRVDFWRGSMVVKIEAKLERDEFGIRLDTVDGQEFSK